MGDTQQQEQNKHRDKVVEEILSSERVYVENLRILVEEIEAELTLLADTNQAIISKDHIPIIFSNINDILIINTELLDRLEELTKNWNENSNIGDFFNKLIPYLKLYSSYVKNHERSNNILRYYQKKDSFNKWISSKFTRYKEQNLNSFLIMPVQRLPRYELLLKELIQSTYKNHPDYESLQQAYNKITEVNRLCNDTINQEKNREKLVSIFNSFSKHKELKDFLSPDRKFICEGPMMKVSRKKHLKRFFFLFNDIFLYATPSGNQYTLHRKMNLSETRIENLKDSNGLKNAFVIKNLRKSFTVFTDSAETKELWIKNISNQIEKIKKSQKNENGDENQIIEAPVWIPDSQTKGCMICKKTFTTFKRKHHCRNCGLVVCGSCSSKRLMMKHIDPKKPVRICDICYGKLNAKTDSPKQENSPKQEKSKRILEKESLSVISKVSKGDKQEKHKNQNEKQKEQQNQENQEQKQENQEQNQEQENQIKENQENQENQEYQIQEIQENQEYQIEEYQIEENQENQENQIEENQENSN